MRRWIALAVVAASIVSLAGCGSSDSGSTTASGGLSGDPTCTEFLDASDDDQTAAAEDAGDDADDPRAGESDYVDVLATACEDEPDEELDDVAETLAPLSPRACQTERRTLATAIEAFYAQSGEWPGDTAALVRAGLLREEPTGGYEVGPEGSIAGECGGVSAEDSADDGSYDDGSYDDGSYDDGSYDDGSYDDGSYDDGSYGSSDATVNSCRTEKRTLATAIEAYYAQYGAWPADGNTLVDAGLLREEPSLGYTVGGGGSIVGSCPD